MFSLNAVISFALVPIGVACYYTNERSRKEELRMGCSVTNY